MTEDGMNVTEIETQEIGGVVGAGVDLPFGAQEDGQETLAMMDTMTQEETKPNMLVTPEDLRPQSEKVRVNMLLNYALFLC